MADNGEVAQPNWDYYFRTAVLLAEQVGGGYANDVWHVRTEGGDYIVKITKSPPRPDRHFWDGLEKLFGLNIFESITKRKQLAEFLQQHTHLRVPDIYYVEREDAKIDSPHLVMERLPGETLDLAQGENREGQARSLGEHLGQLHSATFSDWGCYPEPRYPADAWPKRLAATLSYMAFAWYEEDETVLAPLNDLVKQARQLAPPDVYALVMPDFRMAQFLEKEGELSALVDVESQVLGPPVLDLVVLEYSLPTNLVPAFSEGYRRHRPLPVIGKERALYRYLTFLVQALGGYQFEEWMEAQELIDKHQQLSAEERWSFKFHESIESNEEIFGRFMTFMREVAVAYPGETILVVTHLNMIETLLNHLGVYPWHVDNSGCVKIRTNGVEFDLDEMSGIIMADD